MSGMEVIQIYSKLLFEMGNYGLLYSKNVTGNLTEYIGRIYEIQRIYIEVICSPIKQH